MYVSSFKGKQWRDTIFVNNLASLKQAWRLFISWSFPRSPVLEQGSWSPDSRPQSSLLRHWRGSARRWWPSRSLSVSLLFLYPRASPVSQERTNWGRVSRGATLKVGWLTSDSKWGSWKHPFLSNFVKFPKRGGLKPPLPLPFRGPCGNMFFLQARIATVQKQSWIGGGGGVRGRGKRWREVAEILQLNWLVFRWFPKVQLLARQTLIG